MSNLKIRMRDRLNASPKPGLRQTWTEYQVLDGRKIIARCDTRAQAERFIEEHTPHSPAGIDGAPEKTADV